MTLEHKKNVFIELGKFLSQFSDAQIQKKEGVLYNDLYFDTLSKLIDLSQSHNGWYNKENVIFSLQSWGVALTKENLDQWLSNYDFSAVSSKKIGLILAGNIPLVGFHDFVSVIISGHQAVVKTSSNDQKLLPFLANYLISIEPKLKSYITFTEGKLEGFEAVMPQEATIPLAFLTIISKTSHQLFEKVVIRLRC